MAARLLAAAASDLRSGGLLWKQDCLNVGQDTALCDRYTRQQLVQLFVVTDRKLKMTRNDSCLLVVAGSVTGQLEHFSCQVFHHGRKIDRSSGTDTFGVVALAKQTMNSANRELKTGTTRSALRLSLHLTALSASRHCRSRLQVCV